MTQAGLHVPVDAGSSLPVFQSLFADIGDEQSIASSLSTFSAHITNVVSMDRALVLPALILLDEVGAGTDPAEGGALGTAIIDHFRRRGAHLIATTHYDSLKSYASTTDGVVGAAFGFEPETYAPTYRLVYGSPGRSLAIEIAARLGVPPAVIAAARANLGEREQQLAEHLARVDADLRRLEQERRTLTRDRMAVADAERKLQAREQVVREREEASRTRLSAKLDAQVRDARREIDAVLDALKRRVAEMGDKAAQRAAAAVINTGEAGAARADARAAIDRAIARAKEGTSTTGPAAIAAPAQNRTGELTRGASVIVGGLGVEGVVIDISGKHAEVDVRGKRLRALAADLQVVRGASSRETARVRVNLDLQPRQGSLSELNVIGSTVDEALDRVEKFLDEAVVTEQRVLRIVHGHGTGQLRRAVAGFLKEHPLVARVQTAPQDQGGGGATIVELKD
jgi:DNA mismatch repair protein MutS2